MAALYHTKEFFNQIHTSFADRFEQNEGAIQTFYNLIWDIVMSRKDENELTCFFAIHNEGVFYLAIVSWNGKGYHNTGVSMSEDIDEMEDAVRVCYELNDSLFGIGARLTDLIIMRACQSNG